MSSFLWPQLLVLFTYGIKIIANIVKHGEPRDDKHDGIVAFIYVSISSIVLYFGGFWNPLIGK